METEEGDTIEFKDIDITDTVYVDSMIFKQRRTLLIATISKNNHLIL